MGKEEEVDKFKLYYSDTLKKILQQEEEEEEDYCIYQPLVYPPNSTPPAPNLSRKINFVDFNLIL